VRLPGSGCAARCLELSWLTAFHNAAIIGPPSRHWSLTRSMSEKAACVDLESKLHHLRRPPQQWARRSEAPRSLSLFLVSIFVLTFDGHVHAQQANPAIITGTGSAGVGYVTVSSGANGIDAQVGAWGTPYPYGPNGPPLPGVEPSGASIFYVNINVNDGGLLTFSYRLSTYDAGIYDWMDIYVLTPTGTVAIVSQLGKPGPDWGTFFETPTVAFSQSLDEWKNQQVQVVFSVQQDGWGDQTMGEVIGLAIRGCAIPPLTPLTNPLSLSFEAGNTIDIGDLTQPMQVALACFQGACVMAGGTFTLTSAYRPSPYQSHLREVWDRWLAPGNLQSNTDPACQELKAQVQNEFTRHGLGASTIRPASGNGSHTRGLAIDVVTSGVAVDSIAATCQLYRPFRATDPVHFEHR